MEHRFEKSWMHDNYKIIECIDCGFKHIFPILDEESVEGFYNEKYHSDVKPFNYNEVDENFINNQLKAVDKSIQYEEIFNKVIELKRAEEKFMLDIGCGNDLLALYFKNKGWGSCALEPNILAAQYLRRYSLCVLNDYIEKVASNKFDNISFINAQFVLEHLANPEGFLKKVYDMLKPGGIIRICVPNDFSEGQMAFMECYNEECRWVVFPDHINYFNFASLSGLLSRTGFREIHRTTNFPLEMLLLGGMNYYSDESYKGQAGAFIYNFENALKNTGRKQLLDRYYEELSNIGLGRSIYMYAIKD